MAIWNSFEEIKEARESLEELRDAFNTTDTVDNLMRVLADKMDRVLDAGEAELRVRLNEGALKEHLDRASQAMADAEDYAACWAITSLRQAYDDIITCDDELGHDPCKNVARVFNLPAVALAEAHEDALTEHLDRASRALASAGDRDACWTIINNDWGMTATKLMSLPYDDRFADLRQAYDDVIDLLTLFHNPELVDDNPVAPDQQPESTPMGFDF